MDFTLTVDSETGKVTIGFPNSSSYGGVFDKPSLMYVCMMLGGVYKIFVESESFKYLIDQISGKVWQLYSPTVVSINFKPSRCPMINSLNEKKSRSIRGLIAQVSKWFQLSQEEEIQFRTLLHQEMIRTHHALEQTTTEEIAQLPQLYPFRKVYEALRELSSMYLLGKVMTFGSAYRENLGLIWDVTSCSDYLFSLKNINDERTAEGFKMYNQSVGADVFWILFDNSKIHVANEVLGGVTEDDLATMPLSNGDVLTSVIPVEKKN